MKVVFPQVLYDLIGDYAGDEDWRILFTLTPKSKQLSQKMFVVKRKPEHTWKDKWICHIRYRLQKNTWEAVTLQMIADEHCGMGALKFVWESIHCSTQDYHKWYGKKLQQFCQTILTYKLAPKGRYTLQWTPTKKI